MASEQVCLRWDNFPLNITKNIDDLWKDESLVDVTIYSEGQCIQAHKIILSASSLLFKGIFAVNPCQHPVIILQDVKFQELESIISFIYKGEINIEQKNLPDFLKAAKTLQVRGLVDSVCARPSDSVYEERAFNNDENERPKKKQRYSPIDSFVTHSTEEIFFKAHEDLIPKEEPDNDEQIPPDLIAISDEEDIKNEKNIIHDTIQRTLLPETVTQNDSSWYTAPSLDTTNTYATFPCPFCDKAYTCWGYRRRHIKAMHGKMNEISCRWCPKHYFTQDLWMQHIVNTHKLSQMDAMQGIEILEEAKKVLHLKNERPQFS